MRKRNDKVMIFLSFLAISLGVLLPSLRYLYIEGWMKTDDERIEKFFQNSESSNSADSHVSSPRKADYIGVLEIPSIGLKRGLVDKNSSANNIDKNVQILKDSEMPDIPNSALYLASHSGSSHISFFKDLHKISLGARVFIYYKNIKYCYVISNIKREMKDGDINIVQSSDTSVIVLTTCSSEKDDEQLIVLGELINKESY